MQSYPLLTLAIASEILTRNCSKNPLLSSMAKRIQESLNIVLKIGNEGGNIYIYHSPASGSKLCYGDSLGSTDS